MYPKEWRQEHPHLFHKRPYDHPEFDTHASYEAKFI